jgi:hypothetical protein
LRSDTATPLRMPLRSTISLKPGEAI